MRCPVCKAENPQGPQCRRCKADLSLLFALAQRRRWTLDEARRRLAAADGTEAARLAAEADRMLRDEESHRLLMLAHLLNRDFAVAWKAYRAAVVGRAATGANGS